MTFAVTVALFAWAGTWLDRKLSTEPWLVLVCTLLGVFGGGIHLIVELAPGALGLGKPRPRKGADDEPKPPASPAP